MTGQVKLIDIPGEEVKPGIYTGLNVKVNWDKVDIQGPVYIGARAHIEDGATIVGPTMIGPRSEEHTSELQSQSTISYAVFCLKKKKKRKKKKKKKTKKQKDKKKKRKKKKEKRKKRNFNVYTYHHES